MGRDGWLGIGWPKEFGGQGRSALEQFIFWDETYRARAPLPVIAVNTIGPTLMQFGQRRPEGGAAARRSCAGSCSSASATPSPGGYRPGLPADPRRPRRRRVRDQRPEGLHHPRARRRVHLAGRAHGSRRAEAQGHLDHPGADGREGFSVTPIYTLGRERTNATYYEDVRVPVSNLVGPENAGWGLITSQLNHERITLATPGIRRVAARRGLGAGRARLDCPGRRPHARAAVGADQPRARLREARGVQGPELALRLVAHDRRSPEPWPRPRRSR